MTIRLYRKVRYQCSFMISEGLVPNYQYMALVKYSSTAIRFYFNILLILQMLAVHNSVVSKISVHSKKKFSISKMSPSTQNTQNPEGTSIKNNFTSNQNYWDQSSAAKRVSDLQKQLEDMENQDLQIEAKFQQCIDSMLSQIQRNNENNARLAAQVNNLKQDLAESKQDIVVIEEYIRTNLNKQVKIQEINDGSKMGCPISSRPQLVGSSSSKNQLMRRTPSKLFRSKLMQKQ